MARVAGMLCSPALPAPELWSSGRHSWAKGSTAGRGHNPSHGQQGWGGLGGSAVICFVLLCPGAWEGEPMTGRAFHLAPARCSFLQAMWSLSSRVCVPSGEADFLCRPSPGPQHVSKSFHSCPPRFPHAGNSAGSLSSCLSLTPPEGMLSLTSIHYL